VLEQVMAMAMEVKGVEERVRQEMQPKGKAKDD
jgi:hypothetical protein